MSGGALEYQYHRVNDLADAIRERIVREPYTDEYGSDHEPQPPQVIAAYERAARLCEIAARAAKDVEWRESADTGDESFMQDSLVWTPVQVQALLAQPDSERLFARADAEELALRNVYRTISKWTEAAGTRRTTRQPRPGGRAPTRCTR